MTTEQLNSLLRQHNKRIVAKTGTGSFNSLKDVIEALNAIHNLNNKEVR